MEPGLLTLPALIERMSTRPARIFNLAGGSLAPGAPADVLIADPRVKWVVDPGGFFSKSRNTPFAGRHLTGRADTTIVRGQVVFERAREMLPATEGVGRPRPN